MSQPQQTPSPYFFPCPNPTPAPIKPYSVSTHHINGQFQAQPSFQLHPYAVPQNEAVPLHKHPTFPPAVDSFIGTRVGSTTSPSYGNYSWDGQHLTKGVKETTEPGNIVPAAIRCEVCNVVCNSKDALQAHTQGKKHRKNLLRQVLSSPVSIQNATVEQMIPGTTAATFSEELEKKKQALLKNGAAVGSLLFCTICNAACSDEAVFGTHVVGKKHAAQVAKQAIAARLSNVAGPPNPVSMAIPSRRPPENDIEGEPVKKSHIAQSARCDVCGISCNSHEVLKVHMVGKRHLKNLEKSEKVSAPVASTPPAVAALSKVDVKNEEPQNAPFTRCSICNISCTSSDELKNHLSGKKHRKTVEKENKFIGPLAPPATPPMIGPTGNLEGFKGNVAEIQKPEHGAKRACGSNEDVETKRQKVVGGGAAPDSVRVCRICNVVCNSPTVFISHLAGQKHLAMAKKEAEAGLPSQNA